LGENINIARKRTETLLQADEEVVLEVNEEKNYVRAYVSSQTTGQNNYI
jgi:hypothetical protein